MPGCSPQHGRPETSPTASAPYIPNMAPPPNMASPPKMASPPNIPKMAPSFPIVSSSLSMICYECSRKAPKGILCHGPCTRWYHIKCAGGKREDGWKCCSCTNINVIKGVEASLIDHDNVLKDKPNKCNLNKDLVSSVEETKNVIEIVKDAVIKLDNVNTTNSDNVNTTNSDNVNIQTKIVNTVVICPLCGTDADRGGKIVGCDGACAQWFHATCLSKSKDYHSVIDSERWFCVSCPRPPTELPPFKKATEVGSTKWGSLNGPDISPVLESAYNNVVKWKKNIFKVPSGNAGKAYVKETARLINCYVNNSPLQQVAMTALMIMPALLLQKPSQRSKSKDHTRKLTERLQHWKNGDFVSLVKEAQDIQGRLVSRRHTPEEMHKIFSRLMLQGKVSAALRWVTNKSGALLESTPEVIDLLKTKHPNPAKECSLLDMCYLPKDGVVKAHDVIFENIDATAIYEAAKKTNGSAGPSGLDSDGWQRLLCSKSYGSAGTDLCEAVALLTRKLCTKYMWILIP